WGCASRHRGPLSLPLPRRPATSTVESSPREREDWQLSRTQQYARTLVSSFPPVVDHHVRDAGQPAPMESSWSVAGPRAGRNGSSPSVDGGETLASWLK